jgi:hypothetical protein
MTVVVASIVLLAAIGVPAVRVFIHSFESESGTKNMISAAFASARAMAAQKQRYVGIRFQKEYNRNASDPLDPLTAPQYMIFIVHDPASEPNGTGLANGFRAVEGLKPIKLPDSVGVMDLRLRTKLDPADSGDIPIDDNAKIDGPSEVRDTTTFSVVFSPSGKLVIHEVRVRNRNGKTDDTSKDDVFNTLTKITAPVNPAGMFIQDDDTSLGLGQEYSRNSFIIYDTKEFTQAYKKIPPQAYSGYLYRLIPQAIYINPYTGTIISE